MTEAAPNGSRECRVIEKFVQCVTDGKVDELAECFSADATVEDPVGAPLRVGRDAIHEMYTKAVDIARPVMRLRAPISVTNTGEAAAPLQVECTFPSWSTVKGFAGERVVIDVVDVFEFDADGLIKRMRAYFNEHNVARI